MTTRSKRPTTATTATAATEPGPLVGVDWLAAHLEDDDLRVVHVGHEKRAYNKGHVPGAVLSELHRDLALKGTMAETGDAERGSLLPSREQLEASLRRWRVGEGDRVVFYDDVGLNRHATRAYWLLRRTGYPAGRLHVVDGGLEAWRRADQPLTADVPEADLADGLRVPVRLSEPDPEFDVSYEDVLALSTEATKGSTPPTRLLDVRTASEFVGQDVRARRGGAIPGARQRAFEDFVTPDGTFHSVDAALELLRAGGVDPADVRTVYCHSGVRSSLAWFVLHELAGLDQVRNYAGSWEEWGNREDSPVSLP